MSTIQLIQITPEELQNEILKGVKSQFEDLKKHLQPKQPNEYLTRSEVAKMFSVDLSTIHNWCKSGKLNPLGMGARVYFLRSDIENSLKSLNI
jgi:predicted DNA-binding transcriptional regulator AlpA